MGEATNEVRSINDLNRSKVEPLSGVSAPRGDEELGEEGGREATQIRIGIEQTRANLTETIDALQDKLDPSRIAEQVKDQIREKATEAFDTAKIAVKEATIGRAEKMVASVSETVTDMTGRAGTAVRDSSIVQYIRENPIPFALVGIGLGILAVNKRRPEQSGYLSSNSNMEPNVYRGSATSGSSTTEPSLTDRARGVVSGVAGTARGAATSVTDSVRDAASSAAETTRQQFDYVSGQARQGANLANDRLKNTLQENPLALGMAALAAGALVGLTMPSTRMEGEYMGEARDKLVSQAKSVAQDAADKVQRVAGEAGRTFKDAAQKEGLVTA